MDKLEKFLPIVATLLTAAIGAAGVLLQEWRQRRDDRYRQRRARSEASEMVSFIDKWIAAQQLSCSPEEFEQARQTARLQLERVYSALMKEQEAKKPAEESTFSQRLLLLYKPASLGGWILHLLFYLLVIVTLLWIAISVPLVKEFRNEPDAPSPTLVVVLMLMSSLVWLAPALAIRAWAVVVDRRHRKPAEGASASSVLRSSTGARYEP